MDAVLDTHSNHLHSSEDLSAWNKFILASSFYSVESKKSLYLKPRSYINQAVFSNDENKEPPLRAQSKSLSGAALIFPVVINILNSCKLQKSQILPMCIMQSLRHIFMACRR